VLPRHRALGDGLVFDEDGYRATLALLRGLMD
jgi:hypothetical protein